MNLKRFFIPMFGLILIFNMLMMSPSYAQTTLDVTGSNTVFPVINAAAAEWAEDNNVDIAASGPGSGAGFQALLNGQTDIAPMSRAPRASEIESAVDLGIDLQTAVIAWDSLVVFVNPNNPITGLSAEMIQGIYNGTIRTWSELGWEGSFDDQIKVVERDQNSGTHVFFNEFFLKGSPPPASELGAYHSAFAPTNQIVDLVASEENAIGYGGIAFVTEEDGSITDRVRVLNVNEIVANKANAASGEYPVSRALYLVFNENTIPDIGKDFIDFILSERGQEIVDEVGYTPCGTSCGYYDVDELTDFLNAVDTRIKEAFEYTGLPVIIDESLITERGASFNIAVMLIAVTVIGLSTHLINKRRFN
jgi:phosphate transport system substrate-binding protein